MKIVSKTLFLAATFAILLAFSCSSDKNDDNGDNKTALQFLADNDIKAGWNLGNTLDAVKNNNIATEGDWGSWGPGPATQELFNGVKASGFDIVRIPVTWLGHIGAAPDYTISEARLQRVAEIIGYAKTAGIKAMIINIHHDGNTSNGRTPRTWGFLDLKAAYDDPAKKTEIEEQLKKMWTQIANYFKDHGNYLIFETMNEVHTGNWGSVANTEAYKKEQDILFDWNQAALSAIRATGGNNATRFVAVPALGSTEPSYVINAHNRGKLLPDDGGNATDKLIVSVHYYHPWRYTVANVTSQDPNGTLLHTLTPSELGHSATEMGKLKTTFIDNGIAVYLGEWGGQTNTRSNMAEDIKATHIEYMKNVASAAKTNGVLPIVWDDGGNFKLLERSNGQAKTGLWADVLSEIIK